MTRAELLERYRSLPLPTTRDEAWRFTDLRGFDPDAFASNGRLLPAHPQTAPAQTMLDIEAAGVASVSEAGIEIERAPDAPGRGPLPEHGPAELR